MVAQLVEHLVVDQGGAGSTPVHHPKMYKDAADQRACARRSYERNKEKVKARVRARNIEERKRIKELVQMAKAVPCADCKTSYPFYVMDFDHLGNKKFDLAKAMYQSFNRVKEEIEKCEVVCSNCHRKRTHQRARSSTG